jgi:hypothetical protein
MTMGSGQGQGQGSSINAFEMLLNLLISEKLGADLPAGKSAKPEDDRVKEIKDSILNTLKQVEIMKTVDPKKKTEPNKNAKIDGKADMR